MNEVGRQVGVRVGARVGHEAGRWACVWVRVWASGGRWAGGTLSAMAHWCVAHVASYPEVGKECLQKVVLVLRLRAVVTIARVTTSFVTTSSTTTYSTIASASTPAPASASGLSAFAPTSISGPNSAVHFTYKRYPDYRRFECIGWCVRHGGVSSEAVRDRGVVVR